MSIEIGGAPASLETLLAITAPYNRDVKLQEALFESGMKMLRVTIKEGKRITVINLDADSASQLGEAMSNWAKSAGDQAQSV